MFTADTFTQLQDEIAVEVPEFNSVPENLPDYEVKPGQYSVRDNNGNGYYVGLEDTQDAIDNGYTLENKSDYEIRQKQEQRAADLEYLDDQNAEASFYAGLDTATGGLFGIGVGLTGSDNFKERYSAIREANPIITGVGEIGSFLNPYGAMGKSAKFIHKGGTWFTKQLLKETAEGGFKNWLKRQAVKGAVGGVEGLADHGVYKTKTFLTESSLDNIDFNAETYTSMLKDGSVGSFLIGSSFNIALGGFNKTRNALARQVKKGDNKATALRMAGKTEAQVQKTPDIILNNVSKVTKEALNDVISNPVNKVKTSLGITDDMMLKSYDKLIKSRKNIIDKAVFSRIDKKLDSQTLNTQFFGEVLQEADIKIAGTASPKLQAPIKKFKKEFASYVQEEQFVEFTRKGSKLRGLQDISLIKNTSELKKFQDTIVKNKIYDKYLNIKEGPEVELWKLVDEGITGVIGERAQQVGPKLKAMYTKATNDIKTIDFLRSGDSYANLKGKEILGASPASDMIEDLFLGVMLDVVSGNGFDPEAYAFSFGRHKAGGFIRKIFKTDFARNAKMMYFSDTARKEISDFIGKNAQNALTKTPAGVSATANFLRSQVFDELPPKASDDEKIDYLIVKLDEYSSKPDMLMERLSDSISGYNKSLPLTAKASVDRQLKAVELLRIKAPRNPQSATSGIQAQAAKRPWKRSRTQIREFTQYLAAVCDPMTTFQDMGNGRCSAIQRDATKAVYPEMFKEYVLKTVQGIANSEKSIPYVNRLQVSKNLGMAIDSSLEPKNIRALQSLNNPAQEEATLGAGRTDQAKPTQSGLNKLEGIGSRADSQLSKSLNRG